MYVQKGTYCSFREDEIEEGGDRSPRGIPNLDMAIIND